VPNAPGAAAVINAPTATATTITLDAPQTVGTLLLGNSRSASAGYTISGSNTLTFNNSGSAATITVADGTHAISATVEISGGSLAILLSDSGVLSISGGISDDNRHESLTLAGGQLVLSGSNSYGGGTFVEAGTLIVNNSAALPDGSSLTVGAGGTSLFGSTLAEPPFSGSFMEALPALAAVPVPEPAAVSLLLAGAFSAGCFCRFRGVSPESRPRGRGHGASKSN
jgi:autotransporter-associated beta strand protein